MLELKNVTKSYTQGDTRIPVLTDVSLSIKQGERVAIIGASGSGKSTLLSLMSGMDTPDSGEVIIDGQKIKDLDERALGKLRNETIAIIFQSFELVPAFSALENVMLPLNIGGKVGTEEALAALTSVGLEHRTTHLPNMLSGGEEQRVAIARALVQNPKILFADEPTGNLDGTTGAHVLELIEAAASGNARTLVIITHDKEIARTMDRVLLIKDGTVREITL
jgi:putative ABC transport system ATP-binding protein